MTVLLSIAARTGAALGPPTVIVIVCEALMAGEPLSATRNVTRLVVEPCARVGVQVKTPLAGSMLAPEGAPAPRL